MPPHAVVIVDPTSRGQKWHRILIKRTSFCRVHLEQVVDSKSCQIRRGEGVDGETLPNRTLTIEGVKKFARRAGGITCQDQMDLTAGHDLFHRIPYLLLNSGCLIGDDQNLLAVI